MLLIPYKPDPPPAIDGALSKWAKVPNAQVINRPEQVTYGRDTWKSPADLSAKVWLAWREEALYLAADVTDDVVRQKQGGRELWRGDNVQLLLDVTPDDEPERNSIGEGQFQLGFSPGNFRRTGDRLVDLGPEVFVFKPIGVSPQGMRVAAQRTERGYAIEAAVPWTLLKVKPATGMRLSLEVCISDTDGIEAAQEKMMTLSSAPWEHSRKRLLLVALAPADGSAPPVTQGVDIKQSLRVCPESGQSCQPPYHNVDHGDIDHCFAGGDVELVILAQSTVASEPCEGALDDPPAGKDLKAVDVVRSFDDLQNP